MSKPVSLYRAYDAEECLLYVGISNHLMRRLGQHKAGSDWMLEVATLRIDWFKDRAEALEAETIAIKSHSPKWNIVHNVPLIVKAEKIKTTRISKPSDMDMRIINFKAPRAEAEEWQAAAEQEGRTISDVCRKALRQLAKNAKRKQERSGNP